MNSKSLKVYEPCLRPSFVVDFKRNFTPQVETLREESKRFSGSEDSVTSDRGVADRSQAPEEQLIKGETSVLGGTGVPLDDILNGHRQSVGM